MIYYIWTLIALYIRSFIKWILHHTTHMCELQRICYGKCDSARMLGVECSLRQSKNEKIKNLVSSLDDIAKRRALIPENELKILEQAIKIILVEKKINPKAHPDFSRKFGQCVQMIWGYYQLCAECEMLRQTAYNSANSQHESQLQKLWNLLMPYNPLDSRISKQWQEIGFQGDDPKTDFRGMGLLGLENLVFFANEYPGAATHVLSHSMHPRYGYAFAIVGINLTSMALRLLKDGTAKTHFYNTSRKMPSMRNFHQFYSYLFYEFDGFWIESKPKNIMEFSAIQEKFEATIRLALTDPKVSFKVNLLIDYI